MKRAAGLRPAALERGFQTLLTLRRDHGTSRLSLRALELGPLRLEGDELLLEFCHPEPTPRAIIDPRLDLGDLGHKHLNFGGCLLNFLLTASRR